MSKAIIIALTFSACVLISSPAFASPPDDVLDEITIRVIDNENMSINVNDIALPNIAGEHGVDQPAPDNKAGERSGRGADDRNEAAEAAAENASHASENAAEAAENASENAAEAAENASENAAEAAENASENAAHAQENAAEAAENHRNNAGHNN